MYQLFADGKLLGKVTEEQRREMNLEHLCGIEFVPVDVTMAGVLTGDVLTVHDTGKRLTAREIKGLISGDSISASFRGLCFSGFKPSCKLILSTGRLPRLESSEGFFRRIMGVEFQGKQLLFDEVL
jgi:hypothetical protein